MYNDFYGFSEAPFNVTPDPKFLFQTPDHREALAAMIYGIRERKGFICITGEVGTGKTTLIYTLLKMLKGLKENVKTVFIFHTNTTFEQLFRSILMELDVPIQEKGRAALMHLLNSYLIERLEHRENLVVIIDEAQSLSKDALEGLRMLSNLETARLKLLQIILVGQPELEAKLDSEDLRQLKQRIEIRRRIRPLSHEESAKYIEHRLNLVGSRSSKIFTPEALSLICDHANGIPRTINVICDNALLIGYGTSLKLIDVEIIREVLKDMEGSQMENRSPSVERPFSGSPKTLVPEGSTEPILSSFLVEFIHYLKNTFLSIKTSTHGSLGMFKDMEQGRSFYGIVDQEIKKADTVLNGLLNYIKITNPVRRRNTIHYLLERTIAEFEEQFQKKGIKILKKFENDLPETTIPDEELQFVISSVVQFAILSFPEAGTIGFLTKWTSEEGTGDPKGGKIEVMVAFSKNGDAMVSKDILSKFEAGPDLTLALARDILERRGGCIKLQVDESESKKFVSLMFPSERRKVFYYDPMNT